MNTSATRETGQIVAFPASRRRDLVALSAMELDCLHGEAANLFWRQRCRTLADQLQDLGYAPEDVRNEVLDFQHAVQTELMRRHESALNAGSAPA